MNLSFRGGVHPKGRKELSREAPLRRFDPAPGEMVFPLAQHIGKPAKAVVKKNDPVLVGQKLGEADGFVSACVISSCSGKVKAVEKRRTIAGTMSECVVVENDGLYLPVEGLGKKQNLSQLTNQDILAKVKDAGIIGLGGAGFPTHVKLAPKAPEKIKYLIANGAECEPYITCNDQLMRSRADGIVEGLEIALRLYPNAECVVGIEDNKPEAIAAMQKAVSGKERMRVLPLHTKYPQGGERSLIRVVAGVDYPVSMLPADVGCIVLNVGTAYAIGRAVAWKLHRPGRYHLRPASGGLRRPEGGRGGQKGPLRRPHDGRRRGQSGGSHPEEHQRADPADRGPRGKGREGPDLLPPLRPLLHGLPQRTGSGPDGRRHPHEGLGAL